MIDDRTEVMPLEQWIDNELTELQCVDCIVKEWADKIANGANIADATLTLTTCMVAMARSARLLPPDARAVFQAHLEREADEMRRLGPLN
jgi:hypothetical protein